MDLLWLLVWYLCERNGLGLPLARGMYDDLVAENVSTDLDDFGDLLANIQTRITWHVENPS